MGELGSRGGGAGERFVGSGRGERGGGFFVVVGKRVEGGWRGGPSVVEEKVGGEGGLVVVEGGDGCGWLNVVEGAGGGASSKVTFLEDCLGSDGGDDGLRVSREGVWSSSMFAFFRSFSMREGLRLDISSFLAASISSSDI